MQLSRHAVTRLPLFALSLLIVLTLAGTAAVRWTGVSARAPDAPAVHTRQLRFEDRPDGAVAVIDADSGRLLDTLQGEQGFLRGALRALARERRLRAVGAEPPFELSARSDGRLTLTDPSTGQRLDLEAFGPTNAGVFARLLSL
jgi:putative photosynthetic complex assembly protein